MLRQIFEGIVKQCIEKGLVKGEVILTDSTPVEANMSRQKSIKIRVKAETTDYMKRLDAAEAEERQWLEKAGKIKPQRKGRTKKEPVLREETICTTDPDAGMFSRPGQTKWPPLPQSPKYRPILWHYCRHSHYIGQCE